MKSLIWIGIVVCISQSAMFSGLNLAFFSVSRLRLEIESANNNQRAARVLALRADANFLLTTILWGNVAVNVLLALLAESALAGLSAFFFSTVLITFAGEILPQAYFSRHALNMASRLAPLLRFYQVLLYPVAKTTALILDRWLGSEAIGFFNEKDFRELIRLHTESAHSDIDPVEGRGVLNFFAIDDLPVGDEGEPIDPQSVVTLDFRGNTPVFPDISPTAEDTFLQRVHRSGKKWVIIVDPVGEPRLALNADSFLRAALLDKRSFRPLPHCHRPLVIRESDAPLGETIPRLQVHPAHCEDDVVDEDLIVFWGHEKRIITGSDVLGRLLRGIVKNRDTCFEKKAGER